MNISGIFVHTSPENSTALQRQMTELSGVEVHAAQADGRIVITIEDTADTVPSDTLMSVQNMQGVLSASLIYNYCDDQ
ncbi:MAG: glutamate synthase [Candidatus Electrothrix sp. AR3]|nr:glutamate synthase [Candidatus Electrothrix sp. AR3]